MRPLHDPAFERARELLCELGPVRRGCIRFGKYSSRYDDILGGRPSNIFDCGLASGALMDIGVYCIEPATPAPVRSPMAPSMAPETHC